MAKQEKIQFNEKWLQALKPGTTRLQFFDKQQPGLALRISPAGTMTWSAVYRFGRRMRRWTIGKYPAVALAAARRKARNALSAVEDGDDPAAQKAAERTAGTFGELADQYLKAKKAKRSIREDRRIVDVYLNPRFEHSTAAGVSRSEVGSMLQAIAADAPIMANRVLACIRSIYNWAIGAGILETTPCTLLKAPAPERKRTRNLSDKEIVKVWKALDAESGPVADVYRLRLLTAQRGGEIMGMSWDEIDMKARWWTIPAARAKNKRDHRVWLSDPVMRILERRQKANQKRKKRAGGPSPWVFPGKRKGRPLVEPKRALTAIKDAAGVKPWTGHDLRRTASTAMTRDLKVPRFVVGRVLNHSEGRDVTAHYDVYEYDAEKKDALERWGKRLTTIVSGLKVVNSLD